MQILPHVVFFATSRGKSFLRFCVFDHSSKLKLKFHYTFLTFLGSTILKPYLRKLLRNNLRKYIQNMRLTQTIMLERRSI